MQGRRDLEAASERGDGGAVRVHATWLAMALELSGALDDAAAALIDAEHGDDQADPMVLRAFVPVIRGAVDAQRGDAVSVARQLDSLPEGSHLDIRVQAWGSRAEVWSHALRGEFDAAVDVALRSADDLDQRAWHYWAARLYHDLVRIGRPNVAAEALATSCAAVHVSAVLVHLMSEHAAAATEGDAAALDAVAGGWMAAGAALFAAEASGQASVRHATAGRADLAARSAARAQTWLRRCPGAVTPALAGWRSSLTDREREVGWSAAAGHTSREIADRLVISVRTVDNHLAAVYRKLGISGRDELGPALGLVRAGNSDRVPRSGAALRGSDLATGAQPSS